MGGIGVLKEKRMTDIEAVRDACRGSFLANEDLLPTKQTWNWYNIFAFWMSDVHSAGGYVFAGTLFSLGLAGVRKPDSRHSHRTGVGESDRCA